MKRRLIALLTATTLCFSLAACGSSGSEETNDSTSSDVEVAAETSEEAAYIEETLNLANNEDQEWTYSSDSDSWTLSIVSAVVYPEIEDEQGVSVCVPGAYVKGIDTDGDGTEDVTADDATEAVTGSLVIDYDAEITSSNGQTYTAATAPVIVNTGAAGYSSSTNTTAAATYASEGYINMSCGNRGKQDTATDEDGNEYYTGDAPSCLVDQKNAIRYVKYNILLGNLPGNVDYFVSTGGSGGGAHATMVAATSNNSVFYDYEIECGAVGVYQTEDGSYTTAVSIDGTTYEISDGVWGCVAYSAITSLYEADMAMAFEYYMDTDYDFGTDFKTQMAEYLSAEYMDYINEQNLSVNEADVDLDINGDGDKEDTIELSIEYDEEKYADTNGYGGTYLDFYIAEFISNLQWYLDNIDYADGWTWFNEDGSAMSDEEVAAMTTEDKATAFIEGRYAQSSSSEGGMEGGPGGDMGGGAPSGEAPSGDMGEMPSGEAPSDASADTSSETTTDDSASTESTDDSDRSFANSDVAENSSGDTMDVGTPDAGTTQASGSSTDSSNYSTFEEMLEAYQSDIAEIQEGDEYGNNIVDLYNPLNYIGDGDTDDSTWVRILCGASEGDISMFNSLNIQIKMLAAGIDCNIEWQWDGGHVPSEILGESLALYVDEMYGEYVDGATEITKPAAEAQTTNGDATEATGTDISSWVNYTDTTAVSFSLADAVSYRTKGASKSVPGFDVIDYGQEDYVFGDSDDDARHWSETVLKVLEENADTLSELFNSGS
ncbi:MAG: hypothetical protein K6F30_10025 [Lachnospiraceae bacterium]|nr:hypothetical protein [Lachnospiraceae bacterium]